jgi:hypothetical protein
MTGLLHLDSRISLLLRLSNIPHVDGLQSAYLAPLTDTVIRIVYIPVLVPASNSLGDRPRSWHILISTSMTSDGICGHYEWWANAMAWLWDKISKVC